LPKFLHFLKTKELKNNMRDKNSLIGWLLIGLVFVVFMVYNSKQSQKQAELMRIQQATEAVAKVKSDSIKKENAIKEEKN
jgi:hypothetical protein